MILISEDSEIYNLKSFNLFTVVLFPNLNFKLRFKFGNDFFHHAVCFLSRECSIFSIEYHMKSITGSAISKIKDVKQINVDN